MAQMDPEARALWRRKAYLKSHYGMTLEEYDAKLVAQDGTCAICQNECMTGKRLAVDHCHETGVNRDLLCNKCNTVLGKLQDDPLRICNFIDYLLRHHPDRFSVAPIVASNTI